MYLLLTLLIILVTIAIGYLKFNRVTKILKPIPGPPTNFFFGNALDFPTSKDLLINFEKYIKKYGEVVKVAIGPIPNIILIMDYKLIEFLLSSSTMLRKSNQYSFFYQWLGETGLLLNTGDEKWRAHRKILTPAFHFKILKEFIPLFEKFSNIFVDKLKDEVGKPSFNIYPYVTLCTLDIICETAMGTSVNAQCDTESDYVKSVATMCQIMIERTFNPLLIPNTLYQFSPQYRKEKKAVHILHGFVNSVIENRRKEFESKVPVKVENDIGMKRKLNFLDILLQHQEDGQTLSNEDIREEVDTFMFAGHDTTASAISFTLYSIAQHPEVQQKIMDEMKANIVNYKTKPFTLRDLENLKYLDAVVKESLRLYPPVPIIGRQLNADVKFGDLILPKDVDIIIFTYGLHRNPKYFIEPEKFIPERYLSENASYRLPYEYVPFSAGPRNCIGQKFAMLEIKCVIATVLRNYEVLPAFPEHKLDIVSEVVLQSQNGICMRLIKRTDDSVY